MTLQGILRRRNKVWPQGEAVRTATVPVRTPNGRHPQMVLGMRRDERTTSIYVGIIDGLIVFKMQATYHDHMAVNRLVLMRNSKTWEMPN